MDLSTYSWVFFEGIKMIRFSQDESLISIEDILCREKTTFVQGFGFTPKPLISTEGEVRQPIYNLTMPAVQNDGDVTLDLRFEDPTGEEMTWYPWTTE